MLPATLAELMRKRIGQLDRETQVLLLAAACEAAPTVDLLARVTHNDDLLEQALDNDEGDRGVRVRTLPLLSYAGVNAGEFGPALRNAERAAAYADGVGIGGLTSQVLAVRATIACMCGRGVDWVSMRRALALHDPNSEAPFPFRATADNALLLAWVGRLDEAAEKMPAEHRRCVEGGAETDLIFVAVFTTLIEIWRGRYDDATRVAAETVERAQKLGGDHIRIVAMTTHAAVAAYAGREAETRDAATAAVDLADRCRSPRLAEWAAISLAFLEVSLGKYEQAVQILQPLVTRFAFIPGTEISTDGIRPRRGIGDDRACPGGRD